MRKESIALALAIACAHSAAGAQALPALRVGPFDFNEVPFHAALTQIVRGTGISVVMQDDIPGTLSATGVSGQLDVIIAKMCAYSGASCVFRDGALIVSRRADDGLPAAPSAEPAAEVPASWQLKAGLPVHTQLEAWARSAGWTFAWKAKRSWVVPADTTFDGEFDVAVEAVVKALYDQGKPLTLKLWEGNKVAEVVDGSV